MSATSPTSLSSSDVGVNHPIGRQRSRWGQEKATVPVHFTTGLRDAFSVRPSLPLRQPDSSSALGHITAKTQTQLTLALVLMLVVVLLVVYSPLTQSSEMTIIDGAAASVPPSPGSAPSARSSPSPPVVAPPPPLSPPSVPSPASPSSSPSSVRPPLRVVTYGTHAGYKFCWLLFSCAQEGLSLTILGYNQANQKGLGYKLLSTLDYLRTLHDDEVVLFVDAFDVVVSNNVTVLLQRFHSLGSPLVFSAEKGCWPYLDGRADGEELCLRYYPDAPPGTPYRFVNTGSWMGYVWAARRLLQAIVVYHLQHAQQQANAGQGSDWAASVGQMNNQELVTDYFVCDYLQRLYAEGGEERVLQRTGSVFGDVSASAAVGRIAGCQMTVDGCGEVQRVIGLLRVDVPIAAQ